MSRLVIVSDTHLSRRAPEARSNWHAVVAHVAATEPDLVVHLGDLTLDGAQDPEELDEADGLLRLLDLRYRVIPGNHDVGDNPQAGARHSAITTARRDRWTATFGPDWWADAVGEWDLVAVDAQLFDSGLDAEAAQWRWLEAVLGAASSDRPMVLFTHKPVTAPATERTEAPSHRFLPAAAWQRLDGLLAPRRVPVILSGHVHQYRVLEADGRRHVWAPTTWAVLPDEVQPAVGAKRCGVVTLELHDDGTLTAALTEPPGLRQVTHLRDIPDRYAH